MSTTYLPAGKRFLQLRKSSNAENFPPRTPGLSKKADALVSGREASRRRRARIVSGSIPLKAKKSILNARTKRVGKVKCEPTEPAGVPTLPESPTTDAVQPVSTTSEPVHLSVGGVDPTMEKKENANVLRFPRWLRRPPPQFWPAPIDMDNVEACDPELKGMPLNYIRQGLAETGPAMWHLAQRAKLERSEMGNVSQLPKEINLVIADYDMLSFPTNGTPHSFPTHVFAVWDLPHKTSIEKNPGINPQTGRRQVHMVPAHNVVLAAHCAKWFKLPSSRRSRHTRVGVNGNGAMGTRITLPVVPLAVPHPPTFNSLLQLLYTHDVGLLLAHMVPVAKPDFKLPTLADPYPENPNYVVETAHRLAARYTPHAIVEMLTQVIGLWQNAIYLCVADRFLWIGIDWSWDILLTGLAIAIGKPELVPRPQPKVTAIGIAVAQANATRLAREARRLAAEAL
ncbi:uncharacterized protein BXZ73DRAFT_103351 [Epithele typhae]|uniref:uncharacterized protein n=1 Tax=Epithele typhae TaxID=378194 RepID=UPI002008C3A5|nr:uncharacterized protein BXZ73DRAFT_103351 [Epithele typhae]KAH9924974.1 hypothetical protein BXZ73DRAFT_103351 [Epithele typhae]